MKLKINKLEEKKYIVSFAKEALEISQDSDNWNTEGINRFLIQLGTKTPKDEKIEITCDGDLCKEDKVYNHIYELFNEFAKQYNKLNTQKE